VTHGPPSRRSAPIHRTSLSCVARIWPCSCVNGAFEPEGEFGADPDGFAGFVEEVVGYVSVANDGEAPVVEGDQFGEDLGAQFPAVAGDGVEPQPDAGGHRGVRGGTGRMLGDRVAQHQPCACCSSSGPKTVMALRISRMTPSGWWQAPGRRPGRASAAVCSGRCAAVGEPLESLGPPPTPGHAMPQQWRLQMQRM
jgi:hypothetical protein